MAFGDLSISSGKTQREMEVVQGSKPQEASTLARDADTVLSVPSDSDEEDDSGAEDAKNEGGVNDDEPDELGKLLEPAEPQSSEHDKLGTGKNTTAISENPFENEASRVLFDAIDKLRSCGAGEYIDIPQLVIVGGQSTGKSSLLQGLTEIPFPVGMDTCTRFATRIVSRRTAPGTPRQVKVTIVPPDFNTERLASAFGRVDPENFRDFVRVQDSLTAEEFSDIVREAAEWLGLDPGTTDHHKNFALEMLKVDISGPTRAHFSILDIPGIFSNDLAVKPGEMDGVRQMATEYMSQPENIVICVADAGTDLMMQEIFKLANKHVDPARLIGVFTKCDRLNAADAARVAAMTSRGREQGAAGTGPVGIDNPSEVPQHGWFVVRNRVDGDGGDNDPDFDLGAVEQELFNQQAWSAVRDDRRGTAQLREYLGRLLSDKIRHAFPQLLAKLDNLLSGSEVRLAKLGEARTTTHLRRVYLADLARQYEIRARDALERPWQLDDVRARARSVVRTRNDAFGNLMRACGHMYEFEDHNVKDEEYWQRLGAALKPDEASRNNGSDTPPPSPPRKKGGSGATKSKTVSPVVSSTSAVTTSPVLGTEALLKTISEEVQTCGCTELPGFVHPDVIRRLYRLQTQKWHAAADTHLRAVAAVVQDAARCLLEAVVPPGRGRDPLSSGLWLVVSQLYDKALQTSLGRLKTYSDGDRSKLLQTTDPGFTQRLRLMQSLRLATTISQAVAKVHSQNDDASVEELGAVLFQDAHHSSEANTVLEVHDALKVYYHFALQSFIHHVNNTIVEDFVTNPDGPLRGLSAKYVYALSDSDVDRLGGESLDVAEERRRLNDQIQTLLAAQQTARGALDKARVGGL